MAGVGDYIGAFWLGRSPVRVFCSLCRLLALSNKPLKEMMMSSKRGRLEASSLQQSYNRHLESSGVPTITSTVSSYLDL